MSNNPYLDNCKSRDSTKPAKVVDYVVERLEIKSKIVLEILFGGYPKRHKCAALIHPTKLLYWYICRSILERQHQALLKIAIVQRIVAQLPSRSNLAMFNKLSRRVGKRSAPTKILIKQEPA